MIGTPHGRATVALTLLLTSAAPPVRAVDLHTFSDPAKACAFIATAGFDDIAKVEISLAILQRDLAGGEARDRLMSARGNGAHLDGEARTVEHAVAAIEAQISAAHVQLHTLRGRVRLIDGLPEAERTGRHKERDAAQAQMRATSEELIEMSFDLRDAKARLAALLTAVAGQQDGASAMEAALSTARGAGRAIRDCVRARRANLLVPPLL